MKVFLSYASEQADVAKSIEIALRGEGHDVFLDRSALMPGETFNDQIREAIAAAELFVFLISPEALGSGRYTLTEVEFAEARWPRPSGHLLPVMIRPTERGLIPPYLMGVTILAPRGNVPAAVAAAVARLAKPRWRRLLRGWAAALVLVALVAGGAAAWWGYQQWQTGREVSTVLDAGRLQHQSGDYRAAWTTYERAEALAPRRREVIHAREQLAMDWLDNIRVTSGKSTFTAVVEQVQPVLSRCAVSGEATRAADCLAHQGWGDFLRWREGARGLDPARHYRRALELDPTNVYAHTLSGFEILRTGGPRSEAMAHFAKALASKRARTYVRHLSIAGLLWTSNPDSEEEVIRVANDIRARGEAMPPGDATSSDVWRLWNVYYARLFNRERAEPFLAALPAADHLATFRWLYPEAQVPSSKRNLYLYILATLEEHAGDRAAALATYRKLHDEMAREGSLAYGGRLPARTTEAIARLSKPR